LDYSVLRAATAGVVSAISVESGQVVSAGQSVLTLVQDGEREVEINVPENRIEQIRAAQQIKISFWALTDVVADGKVREISPIADTTTRTYKVAHCFVESAIASQIGNDRLRKCGRRK